MAAPLHHEDACGNDPVVGPTDDRITALARRIADLERTARPRAPEPPAVPGSSPQMAPRSTKGSTQVAAPGHPEDQPGDPVATARAICLRLLAVSARSRASLEQALARRGIPEAAATVVLDRLCEVGLVDDEAYAEAYVRSKHRDRGLAPVALRAELHRKGVAGDVAAAAAAQIDPDAERQRARALVDRRIDAVMDLGPVVARRRLAGLLGRRGYQPSVAASVIEEAMRAYGADSDGSTTDW